MLLSFFGRRASPALIVVSWLGASAFAQTPFTVAYQTPAELSLRQPVVVVFTFENHLSQPIRFDLGFDRTERFVAVMKRPDGTVHRTSLRKLGGGVGRLGRITVEAGQRYTQQLVLNQWLPFDQIGDYDVVMQLQTGVATADGTPVSPPLPGTVHFRITPLDGRRLSEICDTLATIAVSAPNTANRGDAARALSHLDHNSAIPCVGKVLAATDSYDSSMIALLGRIGTPEARALMEQATLSRNDDRAMMARHALNRFVEKD